MNIGKVLRTVGLTVGFTSVFLGLSLLFASQTTLAATQPGDIQIKVIYGDDDRKDLYQAGDQRLIDIALSTVGLFEKSNLVDQGNGSYKISQENFGDSFNLCKDEPFREQPSGAFCSGALVGDDLMMTAGHCIRSEGTCSSTAFVFNYNIHQVGVFPVEAGKDDVYFCSKIVARMEQSDGADFAIIKLDRSVKNRRPLAINRSGKIAKGTEIMVIGHPSGLPTKISGGANVRDPNKDGYFIANLDTYGGNSGSAVFNTRTNLIEGVLVRGEQDFTYRNGCYVSNRCTNNGCRGEDVTKVSSLMQYVPPID